MGTVEARGLGAKARGIGCNALEREGEAGERAGGPVAARTRAQGRGFKNGRVGSGTHGRSAGGELAGVRLAGGVRW